MPEGYTAPSKMMDWSGLANKVATKIGEIDADRQAQKDELDKSNRDLNNTISNTEMGESQTMNGLVIDGIDKGRDQLNKWHTMLKNGDMSPKDYKIKVANLQDQWATFSQTSKSYDDRYKLAVQRQQADENGKIPAASMELELASIYGQTAELNGKSLQIGDDGTVSMSSVDPTTGEVKDLIDIRDINRPENIIVDRVDVSDQVDGYIKNWEPDSIFEALGGGADRTITTLKGTKQYNIMTAKVAETIASDNNPRAQISILTDNGVMEAHYYRTPQEKDKIRQEEIARQKQILKTAGESEELSKEQLADIEFGLVELKKDANGVINPVLTPDQQKASKDRVIQDIDVKINTKITGQGRTQYAPQRDDNNGNKPNPNDYSLYEQLYNSWGSPNGSEALTALSGNKFAFTPIKGGYNVKPFGDWGDGVNITNQKDMAPYFFGTGTGAKGTTAALAAYEKQSKLYWKARQGGGVTTTPTISNGNVR